MSSLEVRRKPDGSAWKPMAREPNCIHPFTASPTTYQPASSCRFCKDGAEYLRWQAEWAVWLEENPDSPEAAWVRQMDVRDQLIRQPHDIPPDHS